MASLYANYGNPVTLHLPQVSAELLAENIVFNSLILVRPTRGGESHRSDFRSVDHADAVSGTYTAEFELGMSAPPSCAGSGPCGWPQVRELGGLSWTTQ